MYKERYPAITSKILRNLERLGNPLKISFDIDGVVQASFEKALLWASHQLKKPVFYEDLVSYWELDKIAQKFGLKPEDASDFTRKAFNRDEVFLNSPPLPGVRSLLGILRDLEIPCVFISSRPPNFWYVTKTWFEKNFPWIDSNEIFLGRQEGESGGNYKSKVITSLSVGLHFEDSLEEIDEIVQNTDAKIVLVPQPWNKNHALKTGSICNILNWEFSSSRSGLWPVIEFLFSDNLPKGLNN